MGNKMITGDKCRSSAEFYYVYINSECKTMDKFCRKYCSVKDCKYKR